MAWFRGRGWRTRCPLLSRYLDRWFPFLSRPLMHVPLHGLTYYLEAANERIAAVPYSSGEYEPEEREVLTTLLEPGDVFLDLGANIGYFSCLAARAVGPTGSVFAFEPDLWNYKLLLKNIRTNGLDNVVAERAAIADRGGVLTLFESTVNHTDHRMYDPDGTRTATDEVTSVRIDDYFDRAQRIDVIKIDIQGFEHHAFRGMRESLRENLERVVVLTEFFPEGLARTGSGGKALLDLLHDIGLETFFLDGRIATESTASAACEATGYTNLIAAAEFPLSLRIARLKSADSIPSAHATVDV